MKFKDKAHSDLYYSMLQLMNNCDVYHKTFAYLISLDSECRKHFLDLYDLEEGCLVENPLDYGWHTGTSMRTAALAYNLYTGHTFWCEDNPSCCSVSDIMCCSYAPYYFEAVKLRYPEYFQGNDC